METISISEARTNLSDIVRRVENGGERIGITVQGRVHAVLGPTTPPATAGPWVQVARVFTHVHDLPKPFQAHVVDDGGINPVLWLNTLSGATVAAIATGRWDTPGAHFAIYYSHPGLPDAILMLDWTIRIPGWSGTNAREYNEARNKVVEVLHEVLPRV